MSTMRLAATSFVSFLIAGCGSPADAPAVADRDGGVAPSDSQAVEADLSGVDGCDLVKAEEVVSLAGAAKLVAARAP